MKTRRACVIFVFVLPLCALMGIGIEDAFCSDDRIDCVIQQGPCIKEAGQGMRILFDIQPRPVKALSDLVFSVTLTRSGKSVTDAAVLLNLSMPGMYMGRNQPVLKHVQDGRYEGKGIITRCMSGRKTWKADISIRQQAVAERASFVFEVQ